MRCSLLAGLVGVLALCSGVGVEGRSVRSLRSLRLPHSAPPAAAAAAPQLAPFDCTFTDAQGNFFDFNRLTTANGTLVVGQASDLYHINVCGGTPSIPACTDAALCMEFAYFKGDYYQLALSHAAPAPVFSSDSATGVVSLTYNNGKMDSTPATTVFQFVCTHDGSTSYTAKRVTQSQWVVQVSSPLACTRPQTECGFDGRDFSSLAGSDMVGSDGQSRYAFYLRLCGAVQSAPAATCAQVNGHTGACRIQMQGGAQTFDLGEWDPAQPPKWEFIDSNAPAKGVQYTMQGARQCWGSGVAEVYVTTVQLVCAQSSKPLVVQDPLQPKPCGFTFVIETPLACPAAVRQPRHIVLTE